MPEQFDFAIVGAGMAGASLAAELAPYASVLVIEAEGQAGYHATGRSAAFWEECYGGPNVVPLTQASGKFLRSGGYLTMRGAIYLGRNEDAARLDAFVAEFAPKGVLLERLSGDAVRARVPGVQPKWCEGIWQPECADIDVGRLHTDYLVKARRAGAQFQMNARVAAAHHSKTGWTLRSERGDTFQAVTLINASGAWADNVARLANIRPLGIRPYRRTVAQLQTDPAPPADLPLVLDISGDFYFKPETGKVWLSPHDEVPSEPCDAAPEEMAVAEAIDRFEQVVDWQVRKVETKWAGLRSFAPDRLPVYGHDPENPAFVWFAGQGGFGIQTAPAAAALMASQLLGRPPVLDVTKIDPATYSPARFASQFG